MEVSVSKEREPASGPPREPVGRPEGLPKSGATGGDAGRPNARRQRSCGCCAARIWKPSRANWGYRRDPVRLAGSVSGRRRSQPESAGSRCGERRDPAAEILGRRSEQDRKSTRLNSSHGYISYAVFCLKKKKKKNTKK